MIGLVVCRYVLVFCKLSSVFCYYHRKPSSLEKVFLPFSLISVINCASILRVKVFVKIVNFVFVYGCKGIVNIA